MANNSSLLNIETIEQLADDMGLAPGEIIPDLVESLENDTKNALANMQDALAAKDEESLQRAAHKLKGSCATLGVETAANLAQELEDEVRAGNIAFVSSMVERLEVVCRQSLDELRSLSF
jgi:HPt (histidine-containing phosphotransfer) domain-containing protein